MRLGSQKTLEMGVGLLGGKAEGLLRYAARKAFYRLNRQQVAKLCRANGLAVDKASSLFTLLKFLVKACLPGLTDGELASILSQRAQKMGHPSLGEIPDEVLEETFEK
eukprot:9811417-Lingulodinium_polyedra.AAC.1